MVPEHILQDLDVKVIDRITIKLTDGRNVERDMGAIMVEVEGRKGPTPVLFGKKEEVAVLGLVTLEACGLTVDTINRRLVPLPEIHQYTQICNS